MTDLSPLINLALSTDAPGLIEPLESKLALTTRSYLDLPTVMPGSSIGAVAINDLANRQLAVGATPRFVTAGFAVGRNVSPSKIRYIAANAREAAVQAEIEFTSIDAAFSASVPANGIYVTLTMLGQLRPDTKLGATCVQPGDVAILTGQVGAHGAALRESSDNALFLPPVLTDSTSLGDIVNMLHNVGGAKLHALHFIADGLMPAVRSVETSTGLRFDIDTKAVPVADVVERAADYMGTSVLELPTAAAMLAIVDESVAERALAAVRRSAHGSHAAVIGAIA